MRRMAKITGRSDDMLIIRGVNVFPTQIEEQILKCPGLAPHFLLEVSRPGRMDELCVRVESRENADGAGQGRMLCQLIKDAIGISAKAEVLAPGAIPRSAGKAVRVLDRRKLEETAQ